MKVYYQGPSFHFGWSGQIFIILLNTTAQLNMIKLTIHRPMMRIHYNPIWKSVKLCVPEAQFLLKKLLTHYHQIMFLKQKCFRTCDKNYVL